MDRLWLYVSLVLWLGAVHGLKQFCTYGEVGSLTLICSNVTSSYFKNTSSNSDEIIETVRCDNCSLAVLEESSFVFRGNRIVTLDLKAAAITQIKPGAFVGLNFLEKLLLSDNAISEVPAGMLKGLKKLRILSMQNNTITSLKNDVFAEGTSLKRLNLHGNAIETIEKRALAGLKNLNDLDLSVNKLTQLNEALTVVPSLQNLNLSSNEIGTLSPNDFSGLASLSRLILSYNKIASIAPDQFSDLPLVELNLCHNLIKTISADSFKGMFTIERLDLSHNYMKDIPPKPFRRMDRLHDLDLAFNYLTTFDTGVYSSGLPELRSLNFSNNHIGSMQTNGVFHMENLHTLDLNSNNISDLNYTELAVHMPKLSYIDLRNNFLPCYLEDDMAAYFGKDSLEFELYEVAAPGEPKKCVNRTKVTPPTAAPKAQDSKSATPAPANAAGHDTSVHHTLEEELDWVSKAWEEAENVTRLDLKNGKVIVHNVDNHYNSKPAVIVIFIMLAGLVAAVVFLSFSHYHTRKMLKQHRAFSQIQLFSSDAEFDTPAGNYQM